MKSSFGLSLQAHLAQDIFFFFETFKEIGRVTQWLTARGRDTRLQCAPPSPIKSHSLSRFG